MTGHPRARGAQQFFAPADRRDKVDYVVKCFATKEDADKFTERFGGEYMTPTTGPKF